MQGIALSRRFYQDIVAPFLAAKAPQLSYAAALFGPGSEVLGFDDEMSRDHNWGLRCHIIVSEADFDTYARDLVNAFTTAAPKSAFGEPLGLRSRPNAPANRRWAAGHVAHGLEVHTLAGRLEDHFAIPHLDWSNSDWLGVSEQKLLEFCGGGVFRDDSGAVLAARSKLAYFPDDVWHYKIAAQWARIGEEQAFVGRAGMSGDDLGSQIVAARLARDVMRMAFLLERVYAPYAKWFGTAFSGLGLAVRLKPMLTRVLKAKKWSERESGLAMAYLLLANTQKALNVAPFNVLIGSYHDRGFLTINAEEAAEVALQHVRDDALVARFPFGAIDQIVDATPALERAPTSQRINAEINKQKRPSHFERAVEDN